MNNINSSSYVSLFNSDTQINNATANTVIICNNDGIITSARNIDADIDTQTININKLNASGPLDAAHFLTGAGTWAIPSGVGNSYRYNNSGLTIAPFLCTMTIAQYEVFVISIGPIAFVSGRITVLSCATGASNNLSFTINGLTPTPATYSEFVPGNMNVGYPTAGTLTQFQTIDITKSGTIFSLQNYFSASFSGVDTHIYFSFSYTS